jgi:eukaryotic-like serine/threonine-protein kinase
MKLEKIIVIAGVIVGWSAMLLFAFDKIVMPIVVKAGNNVRVPDVVEFDVKVAAEQLKKAGFTLVVDGEENNQTVKKDAVITQNPTAYAVTKEGRRIHVIVSKGPQLVTMINVTGISLRQAEMSLKELGLAEGHVYQVYSAKIPHDVVIKQNIAPKTKISAGTTVDLTVSAQ